MPDVHSDIELTLERARARLLAERNDRGYWEGELSSSALSTATACAALALAARAQPERAEEWMPRVRAGLAWLAEHRNVDGGFGDTVDSPSNLSTTALAWMALHLEGSAQLETAQALNGVQDWLLSEMGELDEFSFAAALERIYGQDRTFAVPIISSCTLCGCFGEEPSVWRNVPALPFELAALPQRLFKWLGLPVVSYALPALIAIGQLIEYRRPARNPITRLLRALTRRRTLAKLAAIQPQNGGFLEATPLTSFVVLSLIGCGHAGHVVVERGLEFLCASMRKDGSWPIDTNLATWVTTLAVNALAAGGRAEQALDKEDAGRISDWLAGQQYKVMHPYTGADAGGFAWTDLPGGVPDADDTAGALLALRALAVPMSNSIVLACDWLVRLQNRDGGIPTFCRGWGTLPFDMSCPDLTAHALRAWHAWLPELPTECAQRVRRARERAARHLIASQSAAGAWVPLWFGNQTEAQQENPVYGTSRVLRAVGTLEGAVWQSSMGRARTWLLAAQNADGGFGGGPGLLSTLEETGLALEALVQAAGRSKPASPELSAAIERAAAWIAEATDHGEQFEPGPIGLYFAKLWYWERLYPLVFCVSALELRRELLENGACTSR